MEHTALSTTIGRLIRPHPGQRDANARKITALCSQASSSQPVLVDFTAHWCGPCRLVEPILDQLQKQYEDIKMVKVDADACKGVVDEYKVGFSP